MIFLNTVWGVWEIDSWKSHNLDSSTKSRWTIRGQFSCTFQIRTPKFPTAVLTVLDANANIIKTVDYHNRPSLTYTPITSADSTQRQPLDGYNNAERFEFGSETLNGSDDAERGHVTMVNRLNGTKTKVHWSLRTTVNTFNVIFFISYTS